MSILLSHTTALDYWRSCATVTDVLLHAALLGSTRERDATTTRLQRSLQESFSRQEAARYFATHPETHIITVKHQIKSRNDDTTKHVFTKLPPRSCVRANMHHQGQPLFVSTPEFCFLQMASQLPLEQLIALGFELCGTYATLEDRTLYGAHPLTSPKKLADFLLRSNGFKGVVAARRAARHLIARSASPMETNIAMMLCLPYSLGGYGIPHPAMNHRIDIPESLRARGDSPFRVCDLYWEDAKFAIEYDSDLAHSGVYKTARDALRRSEIEATGIIVMSITRPQVKSAEVFDHLASLVARQTGKRLQFDPRSFKWKHRKLRSLIFARP